MFARLKSIRVNASDSWAKIHVNSRLKGSKKTLKKIKKKLASPWRVPLNGDLTRQVCAESRSKKL
jgi:hypothetical protein